MITAPTSYRGLVVHVDDFAEPPHFFANVSRPLKTNPKATHQLRALSWVGLRDKIDGELK